MLYWLSWVRVHLEGCCLAAFSALAVDVLGSAIAQTLCLPSPVPLALAGGPSVCWHVCFSLMHSSSFGELNAKPSFNVGIFKASLKGHFLPCQPCCSLSPCDPRTWVLDSCSEHQGSNFCLAGGLLHRVRRITLSLF